jgi:4'-phosphopantetheinyl transferase EntD
LKAETTAQQHQTETHSFSLADLAKDKTLSIIDFQQSPETRHESFYENYGLRLPEHLTEAIPKRKLEYLAGRYCASRALGQLGFHEPVTIPTGTMRSPIWPKGYLGAITHTGPYAAAVVGPETSWQGLGIDAEMIVDQSKPSLIRHVCCPNEFENVETDSPLSDRELFTLIFSAKESLFKALFPRVHSFFGFQVATLRQISRRKQCFTVQLVKNLNPDLQSGYQVTGHFIQTENRITTLITI